MKRPILIAASVFWVFQVCPLFAEAPTKPMVVEQKAKWERIWDNKETDTLIRGLLGAVNARFAIGLEQRAVKRPKPGDDDGSFIQAGFPAAIVNIGSWPYGDPNYHGEGDIPERCDVPNAALAVRATLAAMLTLDRER